MKKGYLSSYFKGIATKRLSAVEIDPNSSNQHEFNGVTGLKSLLGKEKRIFNARVIYLGKDEEEYIASECSMTWYDARENHPTRTEHRLYFQGNAALDNAEIGDLMVIALTSEDTIIAFIVKKDSTIEAQITWLFGISDSSDKFKIKPIDENSDMEMNFSFRFIFDDLGIEIKETAEDHLEELIEKFGNQFPATKIFSNFARTTLGTIDYSASPDALIMDFFEREELLFRTFEKHLVAERLKTGFGDDVDSFITYSLSVQNRRKARAGYALENHLEYLFTRLGIKFSRGKETENKAKPDFLFPGVDEYRNTEFSETKLSMLGVKSTCKDRWRQVLSEAARIKNKHLFTLEPAISTNQTNEMKANNLSLVLPESIHTTFKESQKKEILSLSGFVALVKERNSNE